VENHIERSESVPLDSEVLDWMRRVKAADNADELVRHIMEPLEAATPEPTERLISGQCDELVRHIMEPLEAATPEPTEAPE